jgi:hypothetical protein
MVKSPSTRIEPLSRIVIFVDIFLIVTDRKLHSCVANCLLHAKSMLEPAYNEKHHMIHLSSDTGELFANSYQFAQRQLRKLIEKHPMLYPLHTKDGE